MSDIGNYLTGIRDVDRLILNKLNDTDFLQMCSLNRTFNERVCNDDYFRIRIRTKYPETVPYKDYFNEKEIRKETTWKTYFFNILKYIDLLYKIYGYEYKSQDKSPELFFLSKNLVPIHYNYTKDTALIYASENGYLPLVKYLLNDGADIHAEDNAAVRWASARGHLPVVKYLVEHGADITAQDNFALKWAQRNKHLDVETYIQQYVSYNS